MLFCMGRKILNEQIISKNNSSHPIMDGFLLLFPAIKIKKTVLENICYIVYNVLVKKRGKSYENFGSKRYG